MHDTRSCLFVRLSKQGQTDKSYHSSTETWKMSCDAQSQRHSHPSSGVAANAIGSGKDPATLSTEPLEALFVIIFARCLPNPLRARLGKSIPTSMSSPDPARRRHGICIMYCTRLFPVQEICAVSLLVVETRVNDPVIGADSNAHQKVWPGQDPWRTTTQGHPFVTLLDESFALLTRSNRSVIFCVSAIRHSRRCRIPYYRYPPTVFSGRKSARRSGLARIKRSLNEHIYTPWFKSCLSLQGARKRDSKRYVSSI